MIDLMDDDIPLEGAHDAPVMPDDLRDWFASQALTGIMVVLAMGKHQLGPVKWGPEGIAEDAYRIADAMMKERGDA